MQSLFGIIQLMFVCGTILAATFAVLLSLPESKLRDFLMPIIGWCVAIFCGIYCLSPIDIVPEALLGPIGLIDDLGALVTGIAAARMAMKQAKEERH
jgi:uncharacterized membrane protein YkvA (DUF1232 family)